jgi:hypothetical protein
MTDQSLEAVITTARIYDYTIVPISAAELAAADKYESVPWKNRVKGWSPDSDKPPVFTELPTNTTV